MKYKIPFGNCSCGCDTNGNNAGGGNSVTVVGNQARTYKLLTNEDRTVSLQENMVAELDLSKTNGEVTDIDLDFDNLIAAAKTINNRTSLFLKDTKVGGKSWAVCFGSFPFVDHNGTDKDQLPQSNWDAELGISSEELLHSINSNYPIDYWRGLADYCEYKYGEYVSREYYGLLRLRVNKDEFGTYSLSQYLYDFPDMMNLDEIIWYLSELYSSGMIKSFQNVLVPLTDRMRLSEADFRSEGTYFYVAVFKVSASGEIMYDRTVGFYALGNSMNHMFSHFKEHMEEVVYPAFVFCQKRKSTVQSYDIPLTVPIDFNNSGKATIILRNTKFSYLNFKAEGKTFMPYRGHDLIWENTQNSYILPVFSNYYGTIDLETIKRGDEDTILISDHLKYLTSVPGSGSDSDSSNGDVSIDDEPTDILDTDVIHSIYASN